MDVSTEKPFPEGSSPEEAKQCAGNASNPTSNIQAKKKQNGKLALHVLITGPSSHSAGPSI